MRIALRPRTIRGQVVGGLLLFEIMLVLVFAALLIGLHLSELQDRRIRRMEFQTTLVLGDAREALMENNMDRLQRTLINVEASPSVNAVQVTDLEGRTLASSDVTMKNRMGLTPLERSKMQAAKSLTIFQTPTGDVEGVAPVTIDGQTRAYIWVYANEDNEHRELRSLVRITLLFVLIATGGCALVANFLASSITRPLTMLLFSTRRLIRDPEDTSAFPLPAIGSNEAADLTTAFNLMVASIEEQRAGLNDTLALLDSMLANAPIGFAFFDRRFRFVRVNQYLAELDELPVSRHLGRTISDLFPAEGAAAMEAAIERVFESGHAVQDLELTVERRGYPRSWLVNVYPVRTSVQAVRWVGVIIVDTTERKRSEDALRKTEKLAVVGQLAASIAHEINNPLEAVTNLLYLIRHHASLDPTAVSYAEMAQHEVARVSEITQQTLRFYRQSTSPQETNICELFDSVLALHRGRVHTLQVTVAKHYPDHVGLFCFAGEMRQLFTNLVGNALDAMMPDGGCLTLTVRESRSWQDDGVRGVRIFVSDTGSGMTESVQQHIFEPFYTTKEATGTGLGLWVSAEIIEKHSGIVRVRSRTEQEAGARRPGTVFMLFFPYDGVQVPVQPEAQRAADD